MTGDDIVECIADGIADDIPDGLPEGLPEDKADSAAEGLGSQRALTDTVTVSMSMNEHMEDNLLLQYDF